MSLVSISVAISKDLIDNQQLTTILNALKTSINSIDHTQLSITATKFSLGNTKKVGDALDPAGVWNDSIDLQTYVTKAFLKSSMTTELAKKANVAGGVTQFADVKEVVVRVPSTTLSSNADQNKTVMGFTPSVSANPHTYTILSASMRNIPTALQKAGLSGATTLSGGNRVATMADLPSIPAGFSTLINTTCLSGTSNPAAPLVYTLTGIAASKQHVMISTSIAIISAGGATKGSVIGILSINGIHAPGDAPTINGFGSYDITRSYGSTPLGLNQVMPDNTDILFYYLRDVGSTYFANIKYNRGSRIITITPDSVAVGTPNVRVVALIEEWQDV